MYQDRATSEKGQKQKARSKKQLETIPKESQATMNDKQISQKSKT